MSITPPKSAARPTLLLALSMIAVVVLSDGCTRKPPPTNIAVAKVGQLVQTWQLPLNIRGDRVRAIYLREDVLFVYTQKNRVYGIAANSGKAIFSADVEPGGVALKPPLILKDKFAFPGTSVIDVYDRASGRLLDSVKAPRSIRSGGAPSPATSTIYCGLDYPNGGRLAAIDLTRKYDRARWELMTFGGISATPAVYQNGVYCGSLDGRVYAVGEDRAALWGLPHSAFQTNGPIEADVKADDSGVYVASTDSKLYCLDAANGKLRWDYYAGTSLREAPVLTSTTAYLAVPYVGVVAIDKTQGKFNREPKWIARGASGFVAEDEANVYLRAGYDTIATCDKATGKVKSTTRRGDFVALAVNTGKDSTIYASTADGLVMAIKAATKPGVVGPIISDERGTRGSANDGGLDPRR